MTNAPLQIEKSVYGGDGLAREPDGEVVLLPFTLPGETVQRSGAPANALDILKPSPERVEPRCVHFGVCGGCQYQMASYPAQLAIKADILRETFQREGVLTTANINTVASPEPWGYRNRIRLRVRETEDGLRLGYSRRNSHEFLPIRMCPIATRVLWEAAEAVMRVASQSPNAAEWLRSAQEFEIACEDQAAGVQVHLLCPGAVPRRARSFQEFAQQLAATGKLLVSASASRLHVASGRATAELASWGAQGIAYRVGEDSFWLARGSFFQVNRFLLPTMVELVCDQRRGTLAWDLYAGVGLFSRRLARQFAAITAVEANPVAVAELRRGLKRPADQVVEDTTLNFLKAAVLQRDRPDLIVLDPPRAGAGEEVCALLLRLKPTQLVYVSCDPTTLSRDLRVLAAGYRVLEIHMIDLFPQTYHLETVMVLERTDVPR